MSNFDVVAKPRHYNKGKIEVWDFILDQRLDYLSGNIIKYVARHMDKGTPVLDLKKARAYLDKRIAQLEAPEVQAEAAAGWEAGAKARPFRDDVE